MLDEENSSATSNDTLYKSFEEINSNFPKDNICYIGETYSASYSLSKRYVQRLEIYFNTDSDDITLKVGNRLVSNDISIREDTVELTIWFKPTLLDIKKERKFKISLKTGTKPRQDILEKAFTVKKPVSKLKIDGAIHQSLPTSIKLGQKAEAIFIFTNNGDQPVTGINIEVMQLEA